MASQIGLTWVASKFAPRCFNLSYGYGGISIRDQVVRAQLLINDLFEMKNESQVLSIATILIVGAGFAGTVAAICAAKRGFDVTLVDSRSGALSLQRNVEHRYVGAFMYDWPCVESDLQHYPPEIVLGSVNYAEYRGPFWEMALPVTAAELARQHLIWFDDEKTKPFSSGSLVEIYEANSSSVQEYVKKFISSARMGKKRFSDEIDVGSCRKRVDADVVILATGMGAEKCEVECYVGAKLIGNDFWSKHGDDFRATRELSGNALIVGAGDGALQDVLRLMTRHEDVLSIIASMERHPVVGDVIKSVKPLLKAIQLQNMLAAAHNAFGAHEKFDNRLKEIAKKIVSDNRYFFNEWAAANLRSGLGKFYVFHIISGENFTKSYLINKFIVHVISEIDAGNGYKMVKNFDTRKCLHNFGYDADGLLEVWIDDRDTDNVFIEKIKHLAVHVGVDKHGGFGGVIDENYKKHKNFNPVEILGNIPMPKLVYF